MTKVSPVAVTHAGIRTARILRNSFSSSHEHVGVSEDSDLFKGVRRDIKGSLLRGLCLRGFR